MSNTEIYRNPLMIKTIKKVD